MHTFISTYIIIYVYIPIEGITLSANATRNQTSLAQAGSQANKHADSAVRHWHFIGKHQHLRQTQVPKE